MKPISFNIKISERKVKVGKREVVRFKIEEESEPVQVVFEDSPFVPYEGVPQTISLFHGITWEGKTQRRGTFYYIIRSYQSRILFEEIDPCVIVNGPDTKKRKKK